MLRELTTIIPLFQDLTSEQTALLEPIFEAFSCPSGTLIFAQGDKPEYLYLLLQGDIEIRYKPYDGPPIALTHLHAGDAFGWSAVLGSKAYSSSAISDTEIHSVRVRGSDLWMLAEEHPETGRVVLDKLASVVSSRWRNANTQVKSMLDQGVEKAKKNGGKP
jgi:CRP-like cAMP-binding protein